MRFARYKASALSASQKGMLTVKPVARQSFIRSSIRNTPPAKKAKFLADIRRLFHRALHFFAGCSRFQCWVTGVELRGDLDAVKEISFDGGLSLPAAL
jgi:hypothetical protein